MQWHTPVTREKVIRALAAGTITGTVAGTIHYIQLKKLENHYKEREERWKEINDILLRIIGLHEETSLTEEERHVKIEAEMEFLRIVRGKQNE